MPPDGNVGRREMKADRVLRSAFISRNCGYAPLHLARRKAPPRRYAPLHLARNAFAFRIFSLDIPSAPCYNPIVNVSDRKGMSCMKKEAMIRLSTIADVREFVEIVTASARHEIDLASGRYVVDGKSIMGIFSLDLSKPILMTVHGDHAEELLEKLQKFVVKD